jgi:DNA-binding IclR family transcriptional regulator
MSYASEFTTTAPVRAVSAPAFDTSFVVVLAVSTLGLVLSLAATMINPAWFVG